jgi:hypothetical protein
VVDVAGGRRSLLQNTTQPIVPAHAQLAAHQCVIEHLPL